jgi:hypothetical protein
MTRTLSIAALTILAATSFTFAINDEGSMRKEIKSTKPEVTLNVSCIQNAIEKRDSAVIAAHSVYNTSIVNALTARKDALKAAWAKTTRKERAEARNAAWTTFRTSHKSAHSALRTVRVASWNTYNTDMKACGVDKEVHGERASTVKDPTSSL